MRENLDALARNAEAVEERLRADDPETATALRNMLRQVQREQLEENMQKSKQALDQGWLDHAQRLEEEILSTMERLETQRRAWQHNAGADDGERLARSLEDVQNLMRQLQDLQARAEQQQGRNPQQGQNPHQPSRSSRSAGGR